MTTAWENQSPPRTAAPMLTMWIFHNFYSARNKLTWVIYVANIAKLTIIKQDIRNIYIYKPEANIGTQEG